MAEADNHNDKLQQEKNELNALIRHGITFEVKDTEVSVKRRWFGLRRKKTIREVTHRFTICEPTLAVLDRLSAEWIEFQIDDEKLQSTDGMARARNMVRTQAERCARVVAIAVLGEECWIPQPHGTVTIWKEDTARIEELTRLFMRHVKPSKLHQLFVLINTTCNLPDFLTSIRLMQTERTTTPNRIERNNTD